MAPQVGLANTANKKSITAELSREYSVCQTIYQNTSNPEYFSRCAGSVFDKYDVAILEARSSSAYAQKSRWDSINALVNKQWENCDKVAGVTQQNATILREKMSCQNTKLRTLLIEATKLNQ